MDTDFVKHLLAGTLKRDKRKQPAYKSMTVKLNLTGDTVNAESDDIRVGVLLSQQSVYESALLQGTLLGISAINEEGGVLGRRLIPFFGDGKADLVSTARLAERLILVDRVTHIFGGAHSHIRKALVPIVERHNALLWYPNHFEGFEYSPNVIYGGTCPNQSVVPLLDYLLRHGHETFVLLGTDYLYSREINRIARQLVEAAGGRVLIERYIETGADKGRIQAIISDVPKADVIFSTLLKPHDILTYRMLRDQGVRSPIAGVGVNELDLSGEPDALLGFVSSAPYFESIGDIANSRFLNVFSRRFGKKARASWLVANGFTQVIMFAHAAERAKSLEIDAISETLGAGSVDAPFGRCRIDAETNYIHGFSRIAIANARGHFDIVSESAGSIQPDPFLVGHA